MQPVHVEHAGGTEREPTDRRDRGPGTGMIPRPENQIVFVPSSWGGGGKVTAVVGHRTDLVTVEGEVRAFSPHRLQQQLDLMQRLIAEAVAPNGRVEFNTQNDFTPYVLAPDSPAVMALEKALRAVGLTPEPIRYMGGSDANVWNAKGIPTVNIGIGAQKPHTFEEFVLIEDLVKSAEIAFALIQPD